MEEIEVKDYTIEDDDPFSLDKLFGVALMGAFVSLASYYVYHSLNHETKQTIKETVLSAFRSALSTSKES